MSGRHAHPMASRKRAREGQDREARRLAQLEAEAPAPGDPGAAGEPHPLMVGRSHPGRPANPLPKGAA